MIVGIATIFQSFLDNLKIDDVSTEQISLRYGEITSALNKQFRDTESKTNNCLQVGSYGRWTAIKNISDLDMLYIMPQSAWDDYKNNGQSKLLTAAKDAIKSRYPKTNIRVDRLVVCVTYKNFHIEVQPVFEQEDGSFKFPDTYNGGCWKITKPREEIQAMKQFVDKKNNSLRHLCKMTRAWKNKHGIGMGGLLIDTLAHNFLASTDDYDDKSFLYYDWMSRDFFQYLAEQPKQSHYQALGSGQDVKVRSPFQSKAKNAYELCLKAIDESDEDKVYEKWRKVYGSDFPRKSEQVKKAFESISTTWRDTEQFIEDKYPVDIRYDLRINCKVSQDGFRTDFLRQLLARRIPLSVRKKLLFTIESHSVPGDFSVEWKVLNQGEEAQRRDCIRGQIISDDGTRTRKETTEFRGEHIVECFITKDGIVVARDRIDVPISGDIND